MAKRTSKTSRTAPPRPAPEPKPAWPAGDGHSGEGSASALATLQHIEQRRDAARGADPTPPPGEPPT